MRAPTRGGRLRPATAKIGYRVAIGDLRLTAGDPRASARLLRLRGERTMDGIGGWVRLAVFLGEARLPDLGAPIQVELDGGSGAATVFTGEVRALGGDPSSVWIEGADGLRSLADSEFTSVFQECQAGAIAEAILAAAAVRVGRIEAGPTFASYALHAGPSALAHLQALARRCGLDLFTDPDGGVCLLGPSAASETCTLANVGEILSVALERRPPAADGVVVFGEGAASERGSERAHWLSDDLASVTGEASLGPRGELRDRRGEHPRSLIDGALRSGEVVQAVARAQAAALAARRVRGSLVLLGTPTLGPGDLLDVTALEGQHPGLTALRDGSSLRVRGVRHQLDPRRGFTTEVEV